MDLEHQRQRASSTSCLRCGSDKVVPQVPVTVDSAGTRLDVRAQPADTAGASGAGLTARICGECGHAELKAADFRAIYERYRYSKRSRP